jgi:hypothetical protein
MIEMRKAYILVRKLKERDHLLDVDVDGRYIPILKLNLKK